MKSVTSTITCVALAFCLLATSVWAGDAQLIGNGSAPDTISKSDVKKIFLGKKTKWNDGSKITFAVLGSSATHEAFLSNYIGKTPSQFKSFWKKRVFTGKGKKPKSFATDAELAQFVASKAGAVGYVTVGADTAEAKTITIN